MGLEFKLRSLLKLNLKLFAEEHLIRESAYVNIPSGTAFYDGSKMSLLLPDGGAHETYYGIQPGQIFQSAFREWVYQSGVVQDGIYKNSSPVQHSGVYIHGAFRTPNDLTFGYVPDFINGRIIFNNPQSLDLEVHSDFSARDVRVNFEHQFNQQFQEGFLESKYYTNPLTSQQLIYPSGLTFPFPAIFIEVDQRDLKGYEMGNRSAIITDTVRLHVWALDDLQRDNIVDILMSQWHKVIPIIDFNKTPLPLSGIFNTLSPEYVPYQLMLQNRELITTVGSGTPVRYLAYIDDAEADNLPSAAEYERAMVTYRVKTYLNAPTTPMGHTFGPISTLPTIESPI